MLWIYLRDQKILREICIVFFSQKLLVTYFPQNISARKMHFISTYFDKLFEEIFLWNIASKKVKKKWHTNCYTIYYKKLGNKKRKNDGCNMFFLRHNSIKLEHKLQGSLWPLHYIPSKGYSMAPNPSKLRVECFRCEIMPLCMISS